MPRIVGLLRFSVAKLARNAGQQRSLEADDFVSFILQNDFVAFFGNPSFVFVQSFQVVEAVVRLPSHGPVFEEVFGNGTKEFVISQCPEIAEPSVCDDHVNIRVDVTSSCTTNRTTINANLASDPDPVFQEIQNLFNIGLELRWRRAQYPPSFGSPPVASVIPNENVDLFIEEILQVVGMWIIYHMLIAEGIWIA